MLNGDHIKKLSSINSIEALLAFLREDLQWPVTSDRVEDVTFGYEPHELGLKPEHAPLVNKIYQVRPITRDQPWGIFLIDFENKKLPVTLMRRILNSLVIKKRKTATGTAWDAGDLLFMTTYGEEAGGMRRVAFANFHQKMGDLPTLNVVHWDGLDTPAKLKDTYQTLRANLGWPPDTTNTDAWRAQWRKPFTKKLGQVIRTSKALAERLAELSRDIRDRVNEVLEAETEAGPMTKLYKAFQSALIHDLKPADFADTFAQTITYGLFSSAISRTDMQGGAQGTAVQAEDVANLVPITNPFLKEVLETFLDVGGRKRAGIDFDELGVQEVVDLLRGGETDLPAIIRDFGNRKQGEDPVIHFYEDYLKAYNKALKVQRGVFYTPQPVVSYIVRSVHERLQTEFGLEDGLASTITWGEMHARNPEIMIPIGTASDSPFVVVLDPATGTATFLVEVISVIHKHLVKKWQSDRLATCGLLKTAIPPRTFEEFWNTYVPDHLLPRIYGYELMMAPYAIAHMKVGLKLSETGYRFGSSSRVRIYLTNALEPAKPPTASLFLQFEPLAHEAAEVAAVKEAQRYTVVIGNPPYAGLSANLTPTARALVNRYRFIGLDRIREKGALQFEKNLQDDYVKFFAWAEGTSTATGVGLLALICNNGFLDSPTLRGMRWQLQRSFDQCKVLDLHGSSKRPIAGDENVFDIQQGVAVSFFAKTVAPLKDKMCYRAELTGDRQYKYSSLQKLSVFNTPWSIIDPLPPHFAFVQLNALRQKEYFTFVPLAEAISQYSSGTETGFDDLLVAFTKDELHAKIRRFLDPSKSASNIAKEFAIELGNRR